MLCPQKQSKHTEIWTQLLQIQVLNVEKSFLENHVFFFLRRKNHFFGPGRQGVFLSTSYSRIQQSLCHPNFRTQSLDKYPEPFFYRIFGVLQPKKRFFGSGRQGVFCQLSYSRIQQSLCHPNFRTQSLDENPQPIFFTFDFFQLFQIFKINLGLFHHN